MGKMKESSATSTLTEAQKMLGVSRGTLWRLIRTHNVTTFTDLLDNRVKRVKTAEIEKILEEANRIRRGLAA